MTAAKARSERDLQREEILTLTEAAAYLRVEVAAVEQLVMEEAIPARKIGGEWRFLKRALDDWLRFPGRTPRDQNMGYSNGMPGVLILEELLLLLEKRLLQKLSQTASPTPKPGSKQAVLKHIGIFSDDEDLEERLAEIRARRDAVGG